MKNLTLNEVNRFRILSSEYIITQENKIPKEVKNLVDLSIKDIDTKITKIDCELVKKIFYLLNFPYGGTIWAKATFTINSKELVIELGNYNLLTINLENCSPATQQKLKNLIKEKEFIRKTHPIRIEAFFYQNSQVLETCKLSTDIEGPLDNFRYNLFRKKKYNLESSEFERFFGKRGPFINREKYYKHLRKLNLPITYNVETLDRIGIEYSNDPLNDPTDNNYSLLLELAKFIKHNNLHGKSEEKFFFQDIFGIYKEEHSTNEQDCASSLDTDDLPLKYTFKKYSNYYRKIYSPKEDFIRRIVRWTNENFTIDNLSNQLKTSLSLSPIIFGIFTSIAFIYLFETTGKNLNFTFSLYPPLQKEIISHVTLYAVIGSLTFFYFSSIHTIVAKPYQTLLRRILRDSRLIQLSFKKIVKKTLIKIFSITALLGITVILLRSLPPLLGLALAPILLSFLTITTCFAFGTTDNVLYFPNKLFILIISIAIIFNTFIIFSNSSKLYSQSCAYKIVDATVYKYRYFETGNWADKVEIALLPGSSEKWIDETSIQAPTKITVTKSDIRSTVSCTDKFNTWDDAEKYFEYIQKSITDIKWLENLTRK